VDASDFPHRRRYAIDLLPAAKKQAVIEAILNGIPLRRIAEMAGCNFNSVKRYRDEKVLPTLQSKPEREFTAALKKRAKAPAVQAPQAVHVSQNNAIHPDTKSITPLESAESTARQIVRASPVRERLQKLWERTDGYLDKIAADDELLGLASGLLNQAHKNVELLAKVTGEIARGEHATNVSVNIVMPPALGCSYVKPVDEDESVVIDVGSAAKIGFR
jgi:hypothetical protein